MLVVLPGDEEQLVPPVNCGGTVPLVLSTAKWTRSEYTLPQSSDFTNEPRHASTVVGPPEAPSESEPHPITRTPNATRKSPRITFQKLAVELRRSKLRHC